MATLLRDCLCDRLDDTAAGPPCACLVLPGEQVIADYCCECDSGVGMAWVRLSRLFQTRSFPQPITEAPCPPGFQAADLEVGVLRCAAASDEDGGPPSPHALAWDAAVVMDDAAAVMDTLACCLPSGLPRIVGEWRPSQGGGCTGGSATVTVQLVPGPIGQIRGGRSRPGRDTSGEC